MEKKNLEFAASASPAFILQHDELSPHLTYARQDKLNNPHSEAPSPIHAVPLITAVKKITRQQLVFRSPPDF
jgi:hypothetical protein